MEGVTFSRYSPHNSGNSLTEQLVECYRSVFADGPWHEWLKCSKCQKFWGVKDKDILASQGFCHCGIPLVDFWSREQVNSDLHHEITPEASCWLALEHSTVIGFCWGYPINLGDLEEKLGLSFGTNLDNERSNRVAYQDEVGVLPNYRGKKVAKAMVARRLDDFLVQGLQFGIVRTRQSPEPSETFLWYTEKLGYEILAVYPNDDGRVVLGRKLDGLKELFPL